MKKYYVNMKELTDIIKSATAGIKQDFFYLKIDGGDAIYRERVYCYELYHQMRLCWPKHTEFYINGEIDKAAHPILEKLGAARVKPDLLIHKPGYMSGNHAIIEVKSSNANTKGIKKDLETLSLFTKKVGYQRAIYLIYGYKASEVANHVICIASKLKEVGKIELWLHEAPEVSATPYFTICQ